MKFIENLYNLIGSVGPVTMDGNEVSPNQPELSTFLTILLTRPFDSVKPFTSIWTEKPLHTIPQGQHNVTLQTYLGPPYALKNP